MCEQNLKNWLHKKNFCWLCWICLLFALLTTLVFFLTLRVDVTGQIRRQWKKVLFSFLYIKGKLLSWFFYILFFLFEVFYSLVGFMVVGVKARFKLLEFQLIGIFLWNFFRVSSIGLLSFYFPTTTNH